MVDTEGLNSSKGMYDWGLAWSRLDRDGYYEVFVDGADTPSRSVRLGTSGIETCRDRIEHLRVELMGNQLAGMTQPPKLWCQGTPEVKPFGAFDAIPLCKALLPNGLKTGYLNKQKKTFEEGVSFSWAQVRKRAFLRHLYIKVTFSPRHARDKHRENSKKARFIEGYVAMDLQDGHEDAGRAARRQPHRDAGCRRADGDHLRAR